MTFSVSVWRDLLPAVTVVATLLNSNPLPAADLDTSCCADLDERISALEATASSRGDRKIELTISGTVAQQLTCWDDGGTSDAYVHSLASQNPHFKFGGAAKFSTSTKAGYLLRIQTFHAYPFLRLDDGNGMDQNSDERTFGLDTHMSYWFIENTDLGRLTLGRQSNAAKAVAMQTDQSGTQPFDNYTMLTGLPQFIIRSNGDLKPEKLTWAELSFCHTQAMPLGADCNGVSLDGVRYDTPSLNGLVLSASWGSDDFWEAAARYNAEAGGYKFALGAGFSHTDDETTFLSPLTFEKNSDYYQIGGYIQHLGTGLFGHAAYGIEDNHNTRLLNGTTTRNGEHFGLKAGIRANWNSLGTTVVYGDYTAYYDQLGATALSLGATSSRFDRFGGGIAQEFDAASMTLYFKYQHYAAAISGASLDAAAAHLDDADFISVGDIITF